MHAGAPAPARCRRRGAGETLVPFPAQESLPARTSFGLRSLVRILLQRNRRGEQVVHSENLPKVYTIAVFCKQNVNILYNLCFCATVHSPTNTNLIESYTLAQENQESAGHVHCMLPAYLIECTSTKYTAIAFEIDLEDSLCLRHRSLAAACPASRCARPCLAAQRCAAR